MFIEHIKINQVDFFFIIIFSTECIKESKSNIYIIRTEINAPIKKITEIIGPKILGISDKRLCFIC